MLQMAQRAVEMAHQAVKVLQAPSQVNEILVTAQIVHRMQIKQLVSIKPNQLCSNSFEYLFLMEFLLIFLQMTRARIKKKHLLQVHW